MLFNLNRRTREVVGSFLASLGSPPAPGAVVCQLLTRLISRSDLPRIGTVSTLIVTKQTTIT